MKDGTIYRHYRTDDEQCLDCDDKHNCLYSTGKGLHRNLSVPVAFSDANLSRQMARKVDTELGREIYPKRMAIVEPVFANIRIQKQLDRFTLRGRLKVNIQWVLYCMLHNIEKITGYGMAYA